ncbi:MAG: PQQ-binding-like beta-propeller repeat protein [Calditrichaceae bacterium]
MDNKIKKYIGLIAVCMLVVFTACGKPTLKNTAIQPEKMIFTENVNYERQNYIAKDFPTALEYVKDKSINGVATPNLGLFENHIFITTLTGYLSIIPMDNIGKNRKTRLSKGMSASSTLYDDQLFIPMVEGSSGLQIYNIKSGEILWELKGHYSHSSPVVVNGHVYHADHKGEIRCLSAEDGQRVWQANLNDLIYNNLIYAHDHLIAVSQNGQIQFYEPASGIVHLVINIDDFVYAQPMAVNNSLYIISYHGKLYSLNLKTGYISQLEDYDTKVYSSLSSDGQDLYISLSDGTLICRNLENGSEKWSINLNGPISCPVLITNNHAIAATSQKFLYIINKQSGDIIQEIITNGRMNAPVFFVLSSFLFGRTAYISIPDSGLWQITIDDSLNYVAGDTVISILPGKHDIEIQPINNKNWMAEAQSWDIFVEDSDTLIINPIIPSFKKSYLLENESSQNKIKKLMVTRKKKSKRQKYIKPALLATAVATNWASFYIKRKADDYYDIYRESSDLDRMEKYYNRAGDFDAYANIMLGVSAAALTIYFYYLMTD